jgi:hypothetical protein
MKKSRHARESGHPESAYRPMFFSNPGFRLSPE